MSAIGIAIGGAISAFVALLGGVATWRTAGATKAKTVADTYGEAIDRLREDAKEDRDRIRQLEHDLADNREHATQQDLAIATLQSELTRATGELHKVFSWIAAGMPPPPPVRPPWLDWT